jgi:hypothetical protein
VADGTDDKPEQSRPAAIAPPGAAAPTDADSARSRLPRSRRYLVRALLLVATILVIASTFAVWADRQVLNANNWADTSSALLESKAIRSQVGVFIVDQIYADVDVTGVAREALPPRLDPLAGPAASGLRNLAEQRAETFLGRPRVQRLWENANKVAAQQFINIVQGKPGAVTSAGNAVVLDLGVIVANLAQQLGLPSSLVDKLPPNAGQIKILSGDQVTTAKNAASLLNGLAIVLPILSLGLFALAVFLARARRRETLFWVGVNLLFAGAVVLVARNLLGSSVVDAVAKTEAVKPAVQDAWSIGTRMLRDVAQAAIVIGIPVVLAAWLAGPMRAAVALRRAMAPWLNERPDVTYVVVAALLLLIVAWGPIPATRLVIPLLIMIGLVIVGVQALRRQTAREFPDARSGAVSAALRERVRGGTPGAAPRDGKIARLEQLATLHERGALTDEEFAAEKESILAS